MAPVSTGVVSTSGVIFKADGRPPTYYYSWMDKISSNPSNPIVPIGEASTTSLDGPNLSLLLASLHRFADIQNI